MKIMLPFLLIILAVACNTKPSNDIQTGVVQAIDIPQQGQADTTGLYAYQQWKARNELVDMQSNDQAIQVRSVKQKQTIQVKKSNKSSTAARTIENGTSSPESSSRDAGASTANGGTASSESTGEAKAEKKGISKAAKGAVIGGVAGAAGGAVLSKNNRVLGAVIGGVVGAAGGYGIGRKMDKKDGRIDYDLTKIK